MTVARGLLGLGLLLVVACSTEPPGADGPPRIYPPGLVALFMEDCRDEGDEAFCWCVVEGFQSTMPADDFRDLYVSAAFDAPESAAIFAACRDEESGPRTNDPPRSDLDAIIALTVSDLDDYWAATMPEVWGIDYRPPGTAVPYVLSRGEVPECAGPLDRETYEFNAFYCAFDDAVRWDIEGLMASLYEDFGDFAVALVLAHEWGHVVQDRFGFDDVLQPTIVSELQADCFAGSWTGWVAAGGSPRQTLDSRDLEQAMEGFLLIGDELGTAPTGPDAHGTAFERLSAFLEGYHGGAAVCARYEEEWPLIVTWALPSGEDELDLPYDEAAPLLVFALEAFWDLVYPEVFGGPWKPVSEVIPYIPSSGVVPLCGGFEMDPGFYEMNAFYCPADDFVAWDEERLFPMLYAEIGDFALGLVLGLSWAEAVQHRAAIPAEGPEADAQALCMVGVWTAAMTLPPEDNPLPLVLSAGDLEELISALLVLTEPAQPGPTAFDRFAAFKVGFLDGIDACV